MTDEERTAQQQSVKLMRRAGERCVNAEKLSWALTHVMERRPMAKETLNTLTEMLHEYLIGTASITKSLPYMRLLNGEGGGESGGDNGSEQVADVGAV